MNPLVNKTASSNGGTAAYPVSRRGIDMLAAVLAKVGLLRQDADYHLLRAAMVIIFFFFGYQKWFAYEAQRLIPFISNGPLIFWLYPAFGMRGATLFLGASEWTFGALLFLASGASRSGSLGPWARPPRSSAQLRSSHSCRRAGTRVQAGSRP
jgi:Protein of unknown function, DUF417